MIDSDFHFHGGAEAQPICEQKSVRVRMDSKLERIDDGGTPDRRMGEHGIFSFGDARETGLGSDASAWHWWVIFSCFR